MGDSRRQRGAGVRVGQFNLSRRLWLECPAPDVRRKLTPPLATIFRDPKRSEIRTDARHEHPDRLRQRRSRPVADLLMDAGPKAYAAFFPIAQRQAGRQVLPLFQAEIAKKATYSVE